MMKKTYVNPKILVVTLGTKGSILQPQIVVTSQVSEDPDLVKEQVGTDDPTTGGSKSIWDEEW